MDGKALAKYIDHTILKPDMHEEDALRIGNEVAKYNFASACVPSSYLAFLKERLPEVNLCTVISFPFGYDSADAKVKACMSAIDQGANELDLVVNISKVKSGSWNYILSEFHAVNDAVHSKGKIVKWIFENSFMENDEIVRLCEICNKTGADFAKTSTGFGEYGARLEDVELMKSNLSDEIKIKASGGIRTLEEAMSYINLGVSRIGTSSGVKLING